MKSSLLMRGGIAACGALVLSLFSGCASAVRIPLSGAEKQATSAQVCVGNRSHEVETSINPSNVGAMTGGGLLGVIIDAGIDSHRAKASEKVVVPLRDALVGFDLGQSLSDALQSEVSQIDWLKNAKVEATSFNGVQAAPNAFKHSQSDVILIVDTVYRASTMFSTINISVRVSLNTRKASLAKEAKAQGDLTGILYLNELHSTVTAPGAPVQGGQDEYLSRWTAGGGKAAREALGEAAADLAKMIIFDLQQPGTVDGALYKIPADSETREVIVPSFGSAAQTFLVKGYVVHREPKRVWLRMPAGQLISAQR